MLSCVEASKSNAVFGSLEKEQMVSSNYYLIQLFR